MKLGIIGTGKIVHEALFALEPVQNIEKEAIFARPHSQAKAEELAKKYNIAQIYTDYEELLAKADVECVYIGLVNSAHYSYAKTALLAGKHVILEKPFTSTVAEAKELAEIAREKGLYLLEAIVPMHNEVVDRMKMLLPNLGPIKMVQCNYSQYSSRYNNYLKGKVEPAFDPELSGGALYDINLYNIYFSVGLFGKPEKAFYFPNRGFNGIDTSGITILQYPEFTATCTGAKDSDSPGFVIIQGEKGWIKLGVHPSFPDHFDAEYQDPNNQELVPSPSGGMQRAMISVHFEAEKVHHRMTREFADFADIIDTKNDAAAHTALENSLAVIGALESARKYAGIRFGVDDK